MFPSTADILVFFFPIFFITAFNQHIFTEIV